MATKRITRVSGVAPARASGRRARAVKQAIASFELEGLTPSTEKTAALAAYGRGDITRGQLRGASVR